MHLIFIRHGDPDYANDSVSEKGSHEISLLAERAASWKVNECFVSPMGRAQKTAAAVLEKLHVPSETLPWLREFNYDLKDLKTGKRRIAWDWMPREYFAEKKYADVSSWWSTKTMRTGNIRSHYKTVCDGIDSILESYDYSRFADNMPVYNCFPHLTDEQAKNDTHLLASQQELDGTNLLFVCHLGVMFAIISHLTGISPVQLWQGFFVAPSSVTVLGAEERVPGEVVFRVQQLGDVRHLAGNGESVSASGFFGNCLTL